MIGVGLLAVLGLFLIGTQVTVNQLDTYSADLTKGKGDFPVRNTSEYETFYRADGFHLRVTRSAAYGASGVRAPSAHTMLGVEVDVTTIDAQPSAAFGPFAWDDQIGYGLLLDSAGDTSLVSASGFTVADLTVVASGERITSPGRHHDLLLTCTVNHGRVRLVGYVDGTKVVAADLNTDVTGFRYTGFAGQTQTSLASVQGAEWSVAKFWRKGPGNIPTG